MYNYSDRISSLKPSAIREILKVTQNPEVISFAAGSPSPETFPSDEMSAIASELFANQSSVALQYGISEGYTPLRDMIKKRLQSNFNCGRASDELIITSGGQQAIELIAKVLLNEGDVVICEDPSFIGALNAIRSYNTKLVSVPLDKDGIVPDALEKLIKEYPKTRFLYTIPTFQNPKGSTITLERRKKVYEICKKHNILILEDSPYFELRYSGGYVPAIKTLDEDGIVLYVGSFSKIISPGMRIGYVLANNELINKIIVAKQVSDVHTNLFFQMLVANYLEKYDLDAHIEKIRGIYKEKRDHMADELLKNCSGCVSFDIPDGGIFIWCDLKNGRDGFEFCKKLGEKKVAAVPGSSFSVDESAVIPSFRLNFSLPTFDQISRGIKFIAQV